GGGPSAPGGAGQQTRQDQHRQGGGATAPSGDHDGPWKLKADHGLTYEFPETEALRNWLTDRDGIADFELSADGGSTFHDLGDFPQVADLIGGGDDASSSQQLSSRGQGGDASGGVAGGGSSSQPAGGRGPSGPGASGSGSSSPSPRGGSPSQPASSGPGGGPHGAPADQSQSGDQHRTGTRHSTRAAARPSRPKRLSRSRMTGTSFPPAMRLRTKSCTAFCSS
ncbi:MAG: hypothetical protein ABEN55_09115, partial [Bradymonadaceae bacterium]